MKERIADMVVNLDEACRRQQKGEGWFPTFGDAPKQAISIGIKQIMKSKAIISSVPDERKAWAVKHTMNGPVTIQLPTQSVIEPPDSSSIQFHS